MKGSGPKRKFDFIKYTYNKYHILTKKNTYENKPKPITNDQFYQHNVQNTKDLPITNPIHYIASKMHSVHKPSQIKRHMQHKFSEVVK